MIILRNKTFAAWKKGGGKLAAQARTIIKSAKKGKVPKFVKNKAGRVAMDPGGNVGKVVNDYIVQPGIDAPLVTAGTKFLPVPGSTVAANKIGLNQVEQGLYNNIKIGGKSISEITKPVRNKIHGVLNDDKVIGATRGAWRGLQSAVGA